LFILPICISLELVWSSVHVFNETWAIFWLLVVCLVLTARLVLIKFCHFKMYLLFQFCARICSMCYSVYVLSVSEGTVVHQLHKWLMVIFVIFSDVIQLWCCIRNVPIITEMFIIIWMVCYFCACLIINTDGLHDSTVSLCHWQRRFKGRYRKSWIAYYSAACWAIFFKFCGIIHRKVPERWHSSKLKPEVEFRHQRAYFEFLLRGISLPPIKIFHEICCVWWAFQTCGMVQIRFLQKSSLADGGHVPHVQHTGSQF